MQPISSLSRLCARLAIAACSALACMGAQAQALPNGFYVGPQLTRFALIDTQSGQKVNPTAIGVRLGTSVTQYVAVEARAGTSLQSDSSTDGVFDFDTKLQFYLGGYIKGVLPVSEAVSIYGLVGATRTQVQTSVRGVDFVSSNTEFRSSYGAGLDFKLSPTRTIGLEWERLLSSGKDADDRENINGLSASVVFKF